jgi:hypothetical protein
MELPIKKAVFNPNDPTMGLKMISLVNDPAIQVNWIKFSKENEIKLAIQDAEKRIIFTPVLIPDQLIPRDMNGERFNLTFDAQTIEAIAIRWMKDNLSSKVDTEHTGQLIPGVTFYESFITSKDRVTFAKGFESLPLNTWYLTGKVDSDETWSKIKNGEVKGVSIDGIFGIQAAKLTEVKYTEVKVAKDNSLFIDGPIAVGSSVYYNKPENVMINGVKSEIKRLVWENQIIIEDGTVLMLADGKITEIPASKVTDGLAMSILKKLYN